MTNKLNLSPFYVGQKVVGLMNHNNIVKDKVYTITGIREMCGCGLCCNIDNITASSVDNTIILKGQLVECSTCLKRYYSDGLCYYKTQRFAPIQQQSYPLMSFSKIVEKEKEEVLINN